MQVSAKHRFARISPQKCRLVADLVRGLPVNKALEILSFSPKSAAKIVLEVLKSAVANAEHNEAADFDDLYIKTICVDEGPILKRMMPRARGRGNRILKRTSHVLVTVAD